MGKRFKLMIVAVASVIALSSCAAKSPSAPDNIVAKEVPLLEDELVNISSSSIDEANKVYDSKKFGNANNADFTKYLKQLVNATNNPNNEDKLAPVEPSVDKNTTKNTTKNTDKAKNATDDAKNKYEGYSLARDLFYDAIIANSFYNKNYSDGLQKFCELDKEIYGSFSNTYRCADHLMEFLRHSKVDNYSSTTSFYRIKSFTNIVKDVGGEWVATNQTLNVTGKNNKTVKYFEYKNNKTDKLAYSRNSSIAVADNEKYWRKLLELSIFKHSTNSFYKNLTLDDNYADNVSRVLVELAKNSSENFASFDKLSDFEKRNFPKIYANTEIFLNDTLSNIQDRISFKGECSGGNIETIVDNANAKNEDAELEMGCTYYFNDGTILKVLQQKKGGLLVQREPKNSKRKDITEEPMFFIVTDSQIEECAYYNTKYAKYVGFYGYSPEGIKVYAFRALNGMPLNAKDISVKISKKSNIDSTTIYK